MEPNYINRIYNTNFSSQSKSSKDDSESENDTSNSVYNNSLNTNTNSNSSYQNSDLEYNGSDKLLFALDAILSILDGLLESFCEGIKMKNGIMNIINSLLVLNSIEFDAKIVVYFSKVLKMIYYYLLIRFLQKLNFLNLFFKSHYKI